MSLASAGLRTDDSALCVDTGHIYEKRNDVSVTTSLPFFAQSSDCLCSSFHTASHCNKVTAVRQCRGLSDGTKEVCFSVPQTHSAVQLALLKIYEYLGARVHNKAIERKAAHVLQ